MLLVYVMITSPDEVADTDPSSTSWMMDLGIPLLAVPLHLLVQWAVWLWVLQICQSLP